MGDPAIHPGEQLKEELDALSMSAAELACQLRVPPSLISQILHGQGDISAAPVIRLGHFFGTLPRNFG